MNTNIALPPGILKSDLEYKISSKLVEPRHLVFYYTERFKWVITTLLISKGRGAYSDRYYGIDLNGQQVRAGQGPHVLKTIDVWVRESRLSALQKYVDLYNKGLAHAHETRDVISTRRAAGAMRRRFFY